MSEQPRDGNGASSRREKLRADGGWRDSDKDESETDGPRDDREMSPDRDRQDQDQRREQDRPRQGNQPPRDQNRRQGQDQPRQGNQPPREQGQHRGQNQPRQGNQPPRRQQPQRAPERDDDGVSRRQMLAGGGGVAAAAVGGWFVFLRDSGGGPEEVAKNYFITGYNGNFEQAASLVHDDSPSREYLLTGADENDSVDVSLESVESLSESRFSYDANNIEVVREFEILDITFIFSNGERTEPNNIIVIMAKNERGEWKVWDTPR